MTEVLISIPDGKKKTVLLEGNQWTVGRSRDNDFGYPEDSGLSRQHFALHRHESSWSISDLGSKNGTFLNGTRLNSPQPLAAGDRVTASQLTFVFQPNSPEIPQVSIVFDQSKAAFNANQTVSTSLDNLISRPSRRGDRSRGRGTERWNTPIDAFLRAGRELSLGRPLAELFQVILDLSIEAVGAERGVLLTLEGDGLKAQASKGDGFRISTTVKDKVLNEKTSLLVRNIDDEEDFRSMQSIVSQGVRTLMAVPLQTDERVIGLIYVDTSHLLREFTSDDLNLLTVMANVAAIRIERERLAELENARRRLAAELDQAAEIQKQFLPNKVPSVTGLELAGFNASCRTVGGDYYDFLPQPTRNSIVVLVGDVCGKGMPAALLMMSLQARVQVLAEDSVSPAALVQRLNHVLNPASLNHRFISLFLSELSPQSGEMVYCNAGHNPPLLIRTDGAVEDLSGGGPVLGILQDVAYEDSRCVLSPGDIVVLYSDGVTEANNVNEEEFGEARLIAQAQRLRNESAERILAGLRQAVQDWMDTLPAADDITIVLLKKT
jgi:sigma-B regulation protein RsbU (phosphoserine phosphatase)